MPNRRVWEKPAKRAGRVKQKSETLTTGSLWLCSCWILSPDSCKLEPRTADVTGQSFVLFFYIFWHQKEAFLKNGHIVNSNNLAPTFIRAVTIEHIWCVNMMMTPPMLMLFCVFHITVCSNFNMKALCLTWVLSWCIFPLTFCNYPATLLVWRCEVRRGHNMQENTIHIKEEYMR